MKTLGKYHILDTLGKGGFATVYKARDPDLDRAVALKVMEPLLMRDPVWVKRFRQEARAIAQLKHPHIITIYEIGQAEGILFIAMELAEDGSLEARLQQGPLSWAQTLELAQQIAAALDHAHARGVIHRDLKPANILLDPDVGAILTDFGFARLIADHSFSVTMSGGMVGTPSYIPPEVWKGQRADKPADIYAFGAIVYEMITGQKRFDAPSPPAVMMAHFSPPPWPEAWPEDVPPDVVDVLARATEQDPAARFETAGELAEALAGLSIDRLAEPYAELEAAIAAGEWQSALALADAIKASDPDYRDVAALEQQALAGMEAEARRAQAQQWKQAAEEALTAGNLDAAELALVQWLKLAPEDEEALAFKTRVNELRMQKETTEKKDEEVISGAGDGVAEDEMRVAGDRTVIGGQRPEVGRGELLRQSSSQSPPQKVMSMGSLWMGVGRIALGWGLSFALIFTLFFALGGALGEALGDHLTSELAFALIFFAPSGVLAGIGTALVSQKLISGFQWRHVILIVVSWTLAFAFGGAIDDHLISKLAFVLGWTLAFAFGGIGTALVLRKLVSGFQWRHVILIVVGWALGSEIGWALGWALIPKLAGTVGGMISFALGWTLSGAIGGVLSGALGGFITLWQIRSVQLKKAKKKTF